LFRSLAHEDASAARGVSGARILQGPSYGHVIDRRHSVQELVRVSSKPHLTWLQHFVRHPEIARETERHETISGLHGNANLEVCVSLARVLLPFRAAIDSSATRPGRCLAVMFT